MPPPSTPEQSTTAISFYVTPSVFDMHLCTLPALLGLSLARCWVTTTAAVTRAIGGVDGTGEGLSQCDWRSGLTFGWVEGKPPKTGLRAILETPTAGSTVVLALDRVATVSVHVIVGDESDGVGHTSSGAGAESNAGGVSGKVGATRAGRWRPYGYFWWKICHALRPVQREYRLAGQRYWGHLEKGKRLVAWVVARKVWEEQGEERESGTAGLSQEEIWWWTTLRRHPLSPGHSVLRAPTFPASPPALLSAPHAPVAVPLSAVSTELSPVVGDNWAAGQA
ncbi:hypothetical protein H4582DRAFT_2063240 [Lactarius indigo]|nr:hypothetical protein H4582DRAFT_2063240 [Lactarius indigo]